jgi:hypothetical protein
MQQMIHSCTRSQDKEAMSEAVANVRWLIAAGICDFQAMLDELHKLQTGVPRDTPAPDEPIHDDYGCLLEPTRRGRSDIRARARGHRR